MRTDLVRTEMRCRMATSVFRHAECMTQRRVLRKPSQDVTRMIDYLQPVRADDEADRRRQFSMRQIHLLLTMPPRFWAAFFITVILAGCASKAPELPYPAFIQVDELDDIFMASLPGVRAKQLAGDPQTRRTSNRIDLPAAWKGTSGGSPGRSLELVVLQGEMTIADMVLRPGGYAFLPAGSLGFNLATDEGAQILYFLNDVDPESIIRSPIIIDSGLLRWDGTATSGISTKELRFDPGNGSRTWLLRLAAGASQQWESSTVRREGYLMTGSVQHSECVAGKIHTWQYLPGGYFHRPAETIHGGAESFAIIDSIWLMREVAKGETTYWPDCSVSTD